MSNVKSFIQKPLITRVLRFNDQKFWFTSQAHEISDEFETKFSNTLYIHFKKSDFPMLRYPKTKTAPWNQNLQLFDYNDCDLATLDWHWVS